MSSMKMPYSRGSRTITSNAHPLCFLEDSGSHLLGRCRHRDMVKSYIARHNKAGRLILKAITEGTSGNDVFSADLWTHENMQAVGALDPRLPPLLAQETTISEMRHDEEKRDRTTDSLGITAPEDRLKMRPDIMMVVFTTNNFNKIGRGTAKKRKANSEQTTVKDMIGRKKIAILDWICSGYKI